jgi:hypothetical protein
MSRPGFRGVWSLVFDGTAVLVFGDAAWEALQHRDFLPLTLFTIFGAMYCAGFLMQISDHRAARAVNVRLQAAGIYFFTAFTTAVSVDDSMYMASAGGHPFQGWWHTILVTSLVGSLVLAGAFVAALVKPRFGYLAGLVGACFAWPYFMNVAWNLPWRNFVWLITIHWDGKLNVEAVLSLFAATAFSTAKLVNDCASTNWSVPPQVTPVNE